MGKERDLSQPSSPGNEAPESLLFPPSRRDEPSAARKSAAGLEQELGQELGQNGERKDGTGSVVAGSHEPTDKSLGLASHNSLALEEQTRHYVDQRTRDLLNADDPENREPVETLASKTFLKSKFYSICLASFIGLSLGITLAFLLMAGFFDPIAKLVKAFYFLKPN